MLFHKLLNFGEIRLQEMGQKKWVVRQGRPPVKGGQNEALSCTYSEMARSGWAISSNEPTRCEMVTTYLEIIWSSELLDLLFPIRLIYYGQLFDISEASPPVFPGWRISGDEGDRTPDLGVANAALSHLSYIPTYITGL